MRLFIPFCVLVLFTDVPYVFAKRRSEIRKLSQRVGQLEDDNQKYRTLVKDLKSALDNFLDADGRKESDVNVDKRKPILERDQGRQCRCEDCSTSTSSSRTATTSTTAAPTRSTTPREEDEAYGNSRFAYQVDIQGVSSRLEGSDRIITVEYSGSKKADIVAYPGYTVSNNSFFRQRGKVEIRGHVSRKPEVVFFDWWSRMTLEFSVFNVNQLQTVKLPYTGLLWHDGPFLSLDLGAQATVTLVQEPHSEEYRVKLNGPEVIFCDYRRNPKEVIRVSEEFLSKKNYTERLSSSRSGRFLFTKYQLKFRMYNESNGLTGLLSFGMVATAKNKNNLIKQASVEYSTATLRYWQDEGPFESCSGYIQRDNKTDCYEFEPCAIHCDVYGSHPSGIALYKRQGSELKAVLTDKAVVKMANEIHSVFELKNFTKSDVGWYVCRSSYQMFSFGEDLDIAITLGRRMS